MARFASVLVTALALAAAGPARAQGPAADQAPRDRARELAREGYLALTTGDARTALARFTEAEALVHAPPHLYYMAQAHERLGELLAAHDLYQRVTTEPAVESEPPAFAKARRDAAAALAAITPRLAAVEAQSGGLALTIDGRRAGTLGAGERIALDPGRHTIGVTASDGRASEHEVVLAEGEVHVAALAPAPDASERDDDDDDGLGWSIGSAATLSLSAVGAAFGAASGVASLGKVDDLDERCPDRHCVAADEALADEARVLGNVSTVSFVVAGAALATGVTLLIVRPNDEATVTIAPGGLWLRGAL